MNTTYRQRTIETLARSYALRDAKGREIGGKFHIIEATYTATPEGNCLHPAGVFIVGQPQATRNGDPYGASQRRVKYDTVEAARAGAEAYFTAAAKRAGKR